MTSSTKMRLVTSAAGAAALVTPFLASALSLKELVDGPITQIGNLVITLLYAFAFLFFIFGAFRYFFLKGADPKSREEGKMFMIWSVIGLAVIFSVWGLVRLAISIIPAA